MNAARPILTFVIPVRNDAARLRLCLESIYRNRPSRLIECLVADNGSTDGSASIAREYGARVLSLPGLRVSSVRNRAAAEARSDLIAFVDADNVLGEGWISAATAAMASSRIGAAGALYLAPPNGTLIQQLYGFLRGRTVGRGDTRWLGSGNLIVRSKAFMEVKGFDESLETCEDVDLCRRLREEGWRLIADADLVSIHLGDPRTLKAIFVGERWRGQDNLRVSLRERPTLREYPGILLPLLVTASILLAGGGMVAAWAGWPTGYQVSVMALIAVILLSVPRALRIITGGELSRPTDWFAAYAVALAYDLGRAVSILAPVDHRARNAASSK